MVEQVTKVAGMFSNFTFKILHVNRLLKIHDHVLMYYVEAIASFNKPKKLIEDAIKKPGCLEDFHPFCYSNKVLSWPGNNSEDELIYLSGVRYKRRFFNWTENGYDLEIGGSKRKSIVNWIIKGDDNHSSLRVRINIDLLYKNRLINWLAWNLYIKFMIQSYINHVVRGFKFFIDTGNKVHSNQFGKHRWFS